ncbi:hypothetical protein HNO93_003971, partial [Agrobacterium vitis]|nr:hypothetical protein [Agrobacterium vitis]
MRRKRNVDGGFALGTEEILFLIEDK